MSKLKLLIVEDEEAILQGLEDLFVFHGYEVDSAKDGQAGLDKALSGAHDLLILDVMLPHVDGFEICNQVREKDRELPIIMLTAKSEDSDIVKGLKLGADDYVAKPFSVQQLVLRVEAVLRRSKKVQDRDRLLVIDGHWEIDTVSLEGKCLRSGSSDVHAFTRREIEILEYLKTNSDRPVGRNELLVEVWGYRKGSHVETRTVDIHMTKLRRKIEKNATLPSLLVTVRGEGYRLMAG